MKRFFRVLALCLIMTAVICRKDAMAAGVKKTVQAYAGTKADLESLLGVSDGTYDGYSVKSSKKKVVSYSKGKVTVKKPGTAVLTLKKGKKTEKYRINAEEPWIRVHMLDVGQGDSFLIQTVNSNILIDTGEYKEYSNLKKQLKQFGADRLDAFIVTHFDTDHYGSAQSIIRDYLKEDGIFVHPLRSADGNRTYENLQKYLLRNPVREKVLSVPNEGSVIDAIGFDGMEFMLLSADEGDDMNDSSIILKLSFFGSSWLFTGDASASVLNRAMDRYPEQIRTDVLKVSHHGSDYSNPLLFIYRTGADIALISVGVDNDYGHPAVTTLSRLEKYTGSIYRTDTDGTVSLEWKDGTYSVSTEKLIKRQVKASTEDGKTDQGTKGLQPEQAQGQVIGNVKSHVYHLPTCGSLPIEKNRKYFDGIADAEAEGYHACGNCVK